jgi:hypothetical protein
MGEKDAFDASSFSLLQCTANVPPLTDIQTIDFLQMPVYYNSDFSPGEVIYGRFA